MPVCSTDKKRKTSVVSNSIRGRICDMVLRLTSFDAYQKNALEVRWPLDTNQTTPHIQCCSPYIKCDEITIGPDSR